MKTVHQKGKFDCGVAAVAMLLCGKERLSRKIAYKRAEQALQTTKRTGIGQLRAALDILGRPLQMGNMCPVPEGGLPTLSKDALVKVRFPRTNSMHWMIWSHRRQELLDPESGKSHFSEFHVLKQIEVAT